MFFVATAGAEGRVNLSPKGMDTLRVLSPERVVWLNLSGSGNETAAHVLENERMTLMFCAFEGAAKILRVYGRARAVHEDDSDWAELSGLFAQFVSARQIFDLKTELVKTSCGTGVPIMKFVESRGEAQLEGYYAEMGREKVKLYHRKKNSLSLDGKPTGI